MHTPILQSAINQQSSISTQQSAELLARARAAMRAVDAYDQAAVDRLCRAVAWAGGFAETGEVGRARQREVETVCRDSGLKFCGPNCIGIINTSIGLTASFSTMLNEHAHLTPGAVSMVSRSNTLPAKRSSADSSLQWIGAC